MNKQRHGLSIRVRLTSWYALALGLALLAYAGLVYASLWRLLSTSLDRQLERETETVERMLEEEDGRVVWDDDSPAPDPDMPHFRVTTIGGKTLLCSPGFSDLEEPAFRFLAREGRIERRTPAIIRVALPTASMRNTLGSLALVLALGIPVVVALAGAGGYLLARRVLAPIGQMAAQAQRITADRLSQRLSIANPADELGRLAGVFNDMIARLDGSFEQLRRFTADASHELRTPLTAMRSVGEVGLERSRSEGEFREVTASMLEEVDRLSRLVDSLLTLSRADGGQVRLQRDSVDLSSMVEEVVTQLVVLAEEKEQSLSVESPGAVWVHGDAAFLRQALVNLVDNAIKYSPEQTEIRVGLATDPDCAVVEIMDGGPGIPPEDRDRIFDRFYRVDKARSREMGGVGLGLAITRWAIEAHGGTVEVANRTPRGSIFRVILPVGDKEVAPFESNAGSS